MKFIAKLGAAAAIAVVALTGTVAPSAALEPAEALALRQAMMKSIGAHMGAIKAGVGAGNGELVAGQAQAIAALAPTIPLVFPKGSGPEAGDTRALPSIWEQWDKFAATTKVLQTEAAALAEVAKSNDKAKMAAQFAKMAKMGCGGCHQDFRKSDK